MTSANFDFLGAHDARLVTLGGLVRSDSSAAISKLYRFSKRVTKLIAAERASDPIHRSSG